MFPELVLPELAAAGCGESGGDGDVERIRLLLMRDVARMQQELRLQGLRQHAQQQCARRCGRLSLYNKVKHLAPSCRPLHCADGDEGSPQVSDVVAHATPQPPSRPGIWPSRTPARRFP